jgi:SAM-dependent methyltransferase
VGNPSHQGQVAAELTGSIRAAYDAVPGSWAAGPRPVYAALATALAGQAGPLLRGARVLDLGAGTGAAGRAALAAGAAAVVAADVATGPLRQCGPRLWPVAGDAAALPFRNDSFGLVMAAFSLTHVSRPDAVLAETRRVGRAIAASTFAPGWTHPAKGAVDAVLVRFGYRPPSWYLTVKQDTEPRFGDPRVVRRLALAAGYRTCESSALAVQTGLSAPAQLAAWRLGLAHVAPFVAGLPAGRRDELRRAAEAAIGCSEPLVVEMLVHLASERPAGA